MWSMLVHPTLSGLFTHASVDFINFYINHNDCISKIKSVVNLVVMFCSHAVRSQYYILLYCIVHIMSIRLPLIPNSSIFPFIYRYICEYVSFCPTLLRLMHKPSRAVLIARLVVSRLSWLFIFISGHLSTTYIL